MIFRLLDPKLDQKSAFLTPKSLFYAKIDFKNGISSQKYFDMYKTEFEKKTLTKWTNKPNSLSKSIHQKLKDAFLVYYK